MSLGAGIYSFLSAEINNRVYPLTLPQNVTLPALSYQLVSESYTVTQEWQQDHPLYDGRRFEEARIQFNAYGRTFDEAEALSDSLKAAITGFRGQWGDVQIESVLPALSLDDYDPDTQSWRRVTDYFIQYIGGSDGS